jgi:YfiH family protein
VTAALPGALRPRLETPGVAALMSTRASGVSVGPFGSLNLGLAVGDQPAAVAENRRRFAAALGAAPVFLRQVHGTRILRLPLESEEPGLEADASFTTEPGTACAVQVADCLPVLFAAPQQRGVAAAHAGWRGMAAGVLETTVGALCAATGCQPQELRAWLGPCIGPSQFEVGADVLAGFGVEPGTAHPRFRKHAPDRWLADLAGLARDRLAGLGIRHVGGGHWCTVEDESRFFSHRRDRPRHGSSGRMAAAVWIERS